MLTELSLNILDIAQNSIRANASLIEIALNVQTAEDKLSILIKDNGCGMTKEQLTHVEDPFFTTRTTRKIGLGIPFLKQEALATGGTFSITSKPGIGTEVYATWGLSHIDRMPLGDITATIHTLVIFNKKIDFTYTYQYNSKAFIMDTREFREVLGGIPFDAPEVSSYIKDFLIEHKNETDCGAVF